jgi:signal transduction histidine kinase
VPNREAPATEFERLQTNMAEGLHALAQPLTVLRGAIFACTNPDLGAAQHARYLRMAAEHAERACGLFECLQQLLAASQGEAAVEWVDLAELAAALAADQGPVLHAAGVGLAVECPQSSARVLAQETTLRQALFTVLQLAIALSSAGGQVALRVAPQAGSVDVTVASQGTRSLQAAERLSLAVAEAHLRHQRGEFTYREDPFQVSLSLPARKSLCMAEQPHSPFSPGQQTARVSN